MPTSFAEGRFAALLVLLPVLLLTRWTAVLGSVSMSEFLVCPKLTTTGLQLAH
jgi:hypothetical protein